MFSKLPGKRIQAILGWKTEVPSKVDILCFLLNSQLFFIAAGVLAFYDNMKNPISWAVICTGEGLFLIFSVLLLMNIDTKNRCVSNTFDWIVLGVQFSTTIVLIFNDSVNIDKCFIPICFLWLSAAILTASQKVSIVIFIYGLISLPNSSISGSETISSSISLSNIFLSIFIKGIAVLIKTKNISQENSSSIPPLAKSPEGLPYTSNIRRSQIASRQSSKIVRVTQSPVPAEILEKEHENSMIGTSRLLRRCNVFE